MTHFVSDPEPADYWVPKISNVDIPGSETKLVINLWVPGLPEIIFKKKGSSVPLRSVDSTMSRLPVKSDLRRFQIFGLASNDEVAAFIDGKQETDWLRISSGGLVRSKHKANVSLDPSDAELASPPVKGSTWVSDTENAIRKILSNPVGRIVLDAITSDVVVQFDKDRSESYTKPSGARGQMTILLAPKDYAGSKAPGANFDEILFHEFAHVLDKCSGYMDLTTNDLKFDNKDFFTITVTNVYASINSRPLRKDHRAFLPMPAVYVGAKGEVQFNTDYQFNLGVVRGCLSDTVYNKLIFVSAPWNPFN